MIPLAYLVIVLIWSTTPLAVQWSNDSLTPIASVSIRMVMALLFLQVVMLLARPGVMEYKRYWKLYLAGSIGLFPNMPLVNTAADYIPSGLIALIFGASPFTTTLLAHWFLKEGGLGPRHYLGLLLAMVGLVAIFWEHIGSLGDDAIFGISLMCISTLLFSSSSVLIRYLNLSSDVHPLKQLQGSLMIAIPGLLLTWFFMEGIPTVEISPLSGMALLYLATVASLLGFTLYFFLLKHITASAISLISLITPVMAVWLGVVANNEPMTPSIFVGTLAVAGGLWLFSGLRLRQISLSQG
jgi:drug/metabolite transporter (DMT)-like permease